MEGHHQIAFLLLHDYEFILWFLLVLLGLLLQISCVIAGGAIGFFIPGSYALHTHRFHAPHAVTVMPFSDVMIFHLWSPRGRFERHLPSVISRSGTDVASLRSRSVTLAVFRDWLLLQIPHAGGAFVLFTLRPYAPLLLGTPWWGMCFLSFSAFTFHWAFSLYYMPLRCSLLLYTLLFVSPCGRGHCCLSSHGWCCSQGCLQLPTLSLVYCIYP